MRKKIIIRAPALSRSGYGEQARFALRSLRQHEDKFDIHLINTDWGATSWLAEDNEERKWFDFLISKTNQTHKGSEIGPGFYDISLQVTIPNEWQPMAKTNIGYTAGIETNRIAAVWVEKSNMMDKIIVVSEHAKHGFNETSYTATHKETGQVVEDFKCETPISVVNFPVREIDGTPVDLSLSTSFNFLTVAQNGPRKNLYNTAKWFVEEFKDNPDVGMVFKIFCRNNSTIDRQDSYKLMSGLLEEYDKDDEIKCKLYLLHGEMSDEEMVGLYEHPDIHCLVNLAHGEGFGLPMFEAVSAELPVMAPEWGGQLDFLYAPVTKKKTKKTRLRPHFCRVEYDIKPVQQEAYWTGVIEPEFMWCYARMGSYRNKLNDMWESHSKYRSLAKKLKKHIMKTHSFEIQSEKFVKAILETQEEAPVESFVEPFKLATPSPSAELRTFE